MKYNTTTKILAVCAALGVVSCTSLPDDINKGIAAGSPHAYYEAGKHIDNTPLAQENPAIVDLLALPSNILLSMFNSPRSASGSFRTRESRSREAIKYFEKGANMGDADCQYEMGVCYENGRGVSPDLKTAKAYYMQAAAQGITKAKDKLVNIDNVASPSDLAGKTLYIDFSHARHLAEGLSTWVATERESESLPNKMRSSYKKTGIKTAEAIFWDRELANCEADAMGLFFDYDDHHRRCRPGNLTAKVYALKLFFETRTAGYATMEYLWHYGTGTYQNVRFTIE